MKKDIYFYWGNETISYMRYMTLYSCCLLNPDWNIYLIKNNYNQERKLLNLEEKQDKTEFIGIDYSDKIKDLRINIVDFNYNMIMLDSNTVSTMSDVHLKDVLNWKLLTEEGGIVADMDILFTAPMDKLIKEDTEVGLICFKNFPQKDYIPVSFMYSSGKNCFFRSTYEYAMAEYNPNIYESCGTLCIKADNLEDIRNKYPDMKIQQLHDKVVFPFVDFPWGQGIDMLYDSDNSDIITDQSVGIHWYGGAPKTQLNNNIINHETVYTIDNTITKLIRRLI